MLIFTRNVTRKEKKKKQLYRRNFLMRLDLVLLSSDQVTTRKDHEHFLAGRDHNFVIKNRVKGKTLIKDNCTTIPENITFCSFYK